MRYFYDKLIEEYFNRHPDAGLAWWMLPLEQQPEGFKQEMQGGIFERLYHNQEAAGNMNKELLKE